MSGSSASHILAESLLASHGRRQRTTCAWLNHYTALRAYSSGVDLAPVDLVPIDGQLLLKILGRDANERTSADTVLPLVLDRLPATHVAVVGGTPEASQSFGKAFIERWPQHTLAILKDGYSGRPSPSALEREIRRERCEVVIIGLGAPVQEQYISHLSSSFSRTDPLLAFTCGGWMDQFAMKDYYPRWAYPLRLTWLVRLAREPRRLWRRYTIDGVGALLQRRELRSFVNRQAY